MAAELINGSVKSFGNIVDIAMMLSENDQNTSRIIRPPPRGDESNDVVIPIEDVALFAFDAKTIHTTGKHAKWTRGRRFHWIDSIDFVSLDANWVYRSEAVG